MTAILLLGCGCTGCCHPGHPVVMLHEAGLVQPMVTCDRHHVWVPIVETFVLRVLDAEPT